MKAVADIFKDRSQYCTQVLCFAGLPDWPMSALTGLLNLDYIGPQLACFPVSILCFL